jgi:hypothetical protein
MHFHARVRCLRRRESGDDGDIEDLFCKEKGQLSSIMKDIRNGWRREWGAEDILCIDVTKGLPMRSVVEDVRRTAGKCIHHFACDLYGQEISTISQLSPPMAFRVGVTSP